MEGKLNTWSTPFTYPTIFLEGIEKLSYKSDIMGIDVITKLVNDDLQ